MALQYGKIQDPTTLPSSTGSVYANPASTKTYVRGITLHNSNSATETAELWVVADSGGSLGAAGDTNKIFKQNIDPGDTLMIDFPHPIVLVDTNDAIFGKATTASKVVVLLHGDIDA